MNVCTEETCSRRRYGRGLCNMHYQRAYKADLLPADWSKTKTPTAERILARVEWSGECLLWPGATNGRGYGVIGDEDRRMRYVHRVMYAHYNGPIPEGIEVCHRCDVRNCVARKHLFPGTHQENVADCVAKDRHVRGERGARKLTEEKVRDIRTRVAAGERRTDLAAEHGVCLQLINGVVNRKRWRHVA